MNSSEYYMKIKSSQNTNWVQALVNLCYFILVEI